MKNERNNGSGFDNSKKKKKKAFNQFYRNWMQHYEIVSLTVALSHALSMKNEKGRKKEKNEKERLSKISNIKISNISNCIDQKTGNVRIITCFLVEINAIQIDLLVVMMFLLAMNMTFWKQDIATHLRCSGLLKKSNLGCMLAINRIVPGS